MGVAMIRATTMVFVVFNSAGTSKLVLVDHQYKNVWYHIWTFFLNMDCIPQHDT